MDNYMKERDAERNVACEHAGLGMQHCVLAPNIAWWRDASTGFAAMDICTASVTKARIRSHEYM